MGYVLLDVGIEHVSGGEVVNNTFVVGGSENTCNQNV